MNARNALTHDDYGDSAVHVGFRIRAACRDCTYDELCCFDGRDGYWDGIYFTDCGEDDAFLFPTREAAQDSTLSWPRNGALKDRRDRRRRQDRDPAPPGA